MHTVFSGIEKQFAGLAKAKASSRPLAAMMSAIVIAFVSGCDSTEPATNPGTKPPVISPEVVTRESNQDQRNIKSSEDWKSISELSAEQTAERLMLFVEAEASTEQQHPTLSDALSDTLALIPLQFQHDLGTVWDDYQTLTPPVRKSIRSAAASLSDLIAEQQTFLTTTDRIEFGTGPYRGDRESFFRNIRTIAELIATVDPASPSDRDRAAIRLFASPFGPADDFEIVGSRPSNDEGVRAQGGSEPETSRQRVVLILQRRTSGPNDTDETLVPMIRIGNRWVPEQIAGRWEGLVSSLRQQITRLNDENETEIGSTVTWLAQFRDETESLTSAKTQMEFDAELDRIRLAMFAQLADASGTGDEPTTANEPVKVTDEESVRIEIVGNIPKPIAASLLKAAADATDRPNSAVVDAVTTADPGLTIFAGPITDVPTFANRLKSVRGLSIDSVDERTRVVRGNFSTDDT
ncbi:hypothetical protein [Stratiformator vulcanicus]|nr:hypothetical protein [Stratiformator vulcanicus]